MLEILAAMTTEGILTGAGGMTILGAVTLLIKRGFHLDVGKVHNGDGDDKKSASVSRIECSITHTALEKLEKERHDAVVAGLNEVKMSVVKIYDELIKEKKQ